MRDKNRKNRDQVIEIQDSIPRLTICVPRVFTAIPEDSLP